MILTDDLTGAGDVGAECLRNGWAVRCFFLRGAPGQAIRERKGVIGVMDMETRRLGGAAAVRRAEAIATWLGNARVRIDYFKIDSTLRGHFLGEAEAVRRALGRELVWIVPANPAMGRWTIGGRHFVNGQPIELSPFGDDWLQPVRSGDLLGAAARSLGTRKACAHLSLARIRAGGAGGLRRKWKARGVKMVVADAVNEPDLRRIARLISRRDLACGAATLARFVTGRPRFRPARRPDPRAGSRGLGVFGSLNPVTFGQLRRAGRRSRVRICWLGPGDLRSPRTYHPRLTRGWAVLALHPGRFGRGTRGKRKGPRAAAKLAEATVRGLARCAELSVRAWRPTDLLMSGGLTAAAVFEKLRISEMELAREISPGLMMSRADSPAGTFRLVTKPGGFGGPNSLLAIMGGRAARG